MKIHGYRITQVLYAGFLLLLVEYFIEERNKTVNRRKPDTTHSAKQHKTYLELYFKNYDVNKLEAKIEKDFNVVIKLEKKNPFDDVFGIWKDKNISIDKIRRKAWQRTK